MGPSPIRTAFSVCYALGMGSVGFELRFGLLILRVRMLDGMG